MNSWPEGVGLIPNRTRVIIIYPTVNPKVVVVPIVTSIFLFPIIVFLLICWLRKMAVKRRQRARLANRDDVWNERSCASIVQRSPPASIIIDNGCVVGLGTAADIELAITATASPLPLEITITGPGPEKLNGGVVQAHDYSQSRL